MVCVLISIYIHSLYASSHRIWYIPYEMQYWLLALSIKVILLYVYFLSYAFVFCTCIFNLFLPVYCSVCSDKCLYNASCCNGYCSLFRNSLSMTRQDSLYTAPSLSSLWAYMNWIQNDKDTKRSIYEVYVSYWQLVDAKLGMDRYWA